MGGEFAQSVVIMNIGFYIVNKVDVVRLNHVTELLVFFIDRVWYPLSCSLRLKLNPLKSLVFIAHGYAQHPRFDLIVNFDISECFGPDTRTNDLVFY